MRKSDRWYFFLRGHFDQHLLRASEYATDHVTERDGLFVRDFCAVGAADLEIRVVFRVSSWKGPVGSSTRVRVWLE